MDRPEAGLSGAEKAVSDYSASFGFCRRLFLRWPIDQGRGGSRGLMGPVFLLPFFCLPALEYTVAAVYILNIFDDRAGLGCVFGIGPKKGVFTRKASLFPFRITRKPACISRYITPLYQKSPAKKGPAMSSPAPVPGSARARGPQNGAPGGSLKSRAYEHIRQGLINGTLCEGAHLSPVELGKELGISHIPVREAISQLASEGLVVQVPRQGAFVRQIQRRELVELIELRGILESDAVVKAARRIEPVELTELENHLGRMESLLPGFETENMEAFIETTSQWMLADLAFHMLLLQVAGNGQVLKVISDHQIMMHMFCHRTDAPEAWERPLGVYQRENFELHRQVFEAVKIRDGEVARQAMEAHTDRARENMMARFDWLRRQAENEDPMARDLPESMQSLVRSVQQRFVKEPEA